MKRNILSLICGLALMLTMFCVPVGAAEQLVAYDYGTIDSTTGTYNFTLGVVTASAATTGTTPNGRHEMSCSMVILTASGPYSTVGSGERWMEATLSGHGNITSAQATCRVQVLGKSIGLSV